MAQKQKIVILGGGVGSIVTAWKLTSEPGWQDRYEISLYQVGWRIGGKGACGRNAAEGHRIEEHGPHIWFGCYATAFQALREAYDYCRENRLAPDSPFQTCFPDPNNANAPCAMRPRDHSTGAEYVNGEWKLWPMYFPPRAGLPGDAPVDLLDQIVALIDWLIEHEEQLSSKLSGDFRGTKLAGHFFAKLAFRTVNFFGKLLGGADAAGDSILHAVRALLVNPVLALQRSALRRRLFGPGAGRLARSLLDIFRKALRSVVELLGDNDDIRRIFLILDLGIANLRGIFADGILSQGFDIINDEDYSDWLKRHHCCYPWSPMVKAIYDVGFSFEKGKTSGADGPAGRPPSASFEAGTLLRSALLVFFGYRGSYVYKMQSGMGDTIFTPLYLALRHRGVKFHFFHRVRNLAVAASQIDAIEMDRQATLKPGLAEYQPLYSVKGLPCWPNQPFYDQLVEGQVLSQKGIDLESAWSGWNGHPIKLQRGVDFDKVVLGISIGAFPYICKPLMDARREWADMVANIATTQTQSFQMWTNKTGHQMGWPWEEPALLGGYTEPIDTLSDMSQTLPYEDWPGGAEPQSVQYWCGPLEDAQAIPPPYTQSDFPDRQTARVAADAVAFLQKDVGPIWPQATQQDDPAALDWSVLFDRHGGTGPARFGAQYVRANIDPSERYVFARKGTWRYRLEPGKSGFPNLFLAGDWTRNGINAGCVESAARGGALAAEAVLAAVEGESPLPPAATGA